MLSEYINAAMKRAHYEIFEHSDGSSYYYGEIHGVQGPLAIGDTLEECRDQLREVVDEWLAVSLIDNDPVPEIDGHWIDVDLIARKVVIEDEDLDEDQSHQEEKAHPAHQTHTAA